MKSLQKKDFPFEIIVHDDKYGGLYNEQAIKHRCPN